MIPPRVSVDIVRERIGTYADKEHTAEERYAIYKDLIGFLPPRIEARINVTGALDPELHITPRCLPNSAATPVSSSRTL